MADTSKDETKQLKDLEKIVTDFTRDLLNTFPELDAVLDENLRRLLNADAVELATIKHILDYCQTIFPERFFDILYKNNTMFEDEAINVTFLPGVDFRPLWKENISDKTRETIWKYLQLILFTTVMNISNDQSFGDTAKLFEAIDENEFRSKLEETIHEIEGMFEGGDNGDATQNPSGINTDDIPDPNTIHEHISGMMNGKLGNLAREIADETAKDLNIDMENATNINDVFKTLFKNPTKLMGIVKNIGDKLDAKIKSGDISESELLTEATEIMVKMKDMPGMGNLQSMLGKMGMGGGGNVSQNAMEAYLKKNLKVAKQKERMKSKADENKKSKETNNVVYTKEQWDAANKAAAELLAEEGRVTSERMINGVEKLVFSTGENYEKSTKLTAPTNQQEKKKKKKNKRK